MRSSVDRSKKESQRSTTFAKGGSTKMFKQQAAGADRPGNTGKDPSAAPGARGAKGGKAKMAAFSPAAPAKSGSTGQAK